MAVDPGRPVGRLARTLDAAGLLAARSERRKRLRRGRRRRLDVDRAQILGHVEEPVAACEHVPERETGVCDHRELQRDVGGGRDGADRRRDHDDHAQSEHSQQREAARTASRGQGRRGACKLTGARPNRPGCRRRLPDPVGAGRARAAQAIPGAHRLRARAERVTGLMAAHGRRPLVTARGRVGSRPPHRCVRRSTRAAPQAFWVTASARRGSTQSGRTKWQV